jgi:hypothetical protein
MLLGLSACLSACSSSSHSGTTSHDAGADSSHADGAADSATDSSMPVDSTAPPQDSGADTTIPPVDSSVPDTAADTSADTSMDTSAPDSSPDVAVDASEDTEVPDTSPPVDTGVPVDSSMPEDSGVPETSTTDTGVADTGTPVDSAIEDTGTPDTGTVDTGTVETGPEDTGTADTGTVDTGTVDTGAPETGGPTFTIGGTMSGLAGGDSVRVLDNGGDAIFVSSNSSFTFPTPLASGATYDVTVANQPVIPIAQTCTVADGTGTVGTSNVTDVTITCVPNFPVGGTLSGLHNGDTVTLRNNGGNALTLTANGPFTFSTELPAGSTYDVTSTSPMTPFPQTCTVTGGTGTVTSPGVSNVGVTCSP